MSKYTYIITASIKDWDDYSGKVALYRLDSDNVVSQYEMQKLLVDLSYMDQHGTFYIEELQDIPNLLFGKVDTNEKENRSMDS